MAEFLVLQDDLVKRIAITNSLAHEYRSQDTLSLARHPSFPLDGPRRQNARWSGACEGAFEQNRSSCRDLEFVNARGVEGCRLHCQLTVRTRRGRRRKESALNMLISSTRSLARTYSENLFCLSYEGLEDCVAVLGVDGKNATPAKKAESIKLLCGSMSVHIQKFCCVHSD